MDYQPRFSERAINDARIIYDQIADHSPERAEKWRRGIFARIDTLRRLPYRCPRAVEGGRSGKDVRELLYGKRMSTYRVLFVVQDDVVTILAIRRATRGPADL